MDTQTKINPLQKYFRQAKLYVKLPSNGKFYPPGAFELSQTGEYPVLPMTAKDELTLKTPDALLNGQATVDVIQSCMPNIKNAWKMPSIDLDACLVAIRMATYGQHLDLEIKVPGSGEERTISIDLQQVLTKLSEVEYNNQIFINDMTIVLKPLTYELFTQHAMKTFEEQRILQLVNNQDISDSDKLKAFNKSFKVLTNITVDMVSQCIAKIVIEDQEVADPKFIQEFIDNADKSFYVTIMDHLEEEKKKFGMEPARIQSTQDDIEKGAPETFEVPITLDATHFFG
jgi:hypothetical protein